MIYGMLIGLIIVSVSLSHQNRPKPFLSDRVMIIRALVRVICLFVFFPSTGALIGLLIRGA